MTQVYVTESADPVTRVWGRSAGRDVPVDFEMTGPIAGSQKLTVEEPVTHFGTKGNVSKNMGHARNMGRYIIQSAEPASTTWGAASVAPTVLMA